ncbi:MAG: xylulokinase [Paraglaciecola sp.]|uniref:xylulokinase n=1 Tax=Paraglaciecola sp. TaxID=1920173 RepID=UPI0032985EB9
MYLGVDLGTSGIKVIITDATGQIVDSQSAELTVSRPKPLWSEQDPTDWWLAFCSVMDDLSTRPYLSQVKAIGLSGQMHGATLLDKESQIIRPAILWNDGRSAAQCRELEQAVANSRQTTGNIMMPGFTAPKLLWLKHHEPNHFSQIDKVLLPKDYLRFLLTGDFACDMSDAAGTLWLNTQKRCWDSELLAACGLKLNHMPQLFEGNQITGVLQADLSSRWGLPEVPVVAGAGDNAAGAIGVGLVEPGQGMISLGTSGVYFVVTDRFSQQAELAVHSFCHALPERWHLMSVMLSAASCLDWFAKHIVEEDIGQLLEQLESNPVNQKTTPYFLPYLSGERTPHNNPMAKGAFIGLTHDTSKLDMLHAVLEGVCFAFADGVDALHQSGTKATEITVIGGGAQSSYWRQLMSDVLQTKITFRKGGEVGPALGAARLAQLAMEPNVSIEQICPQPEAVQIHTPNTSIQQIFEQRRQVYIQAYTQLRTIFNKEIL